METLNRFVRYIHVDSKRGRLCRISIILIIFFTSINPTIDLSERLLDRYGVTSKSGPSNSLVSLGDGSEGDKYSKKIQVQPIFGKKVGDAIGHNSEQGQLNKAKESSSAKSKLDLVLKGIIGPVATGKALAIINNKGRKDEDNIYGVGDVVQDSVIIEKIFSDRVIVSTSGKIVTLYVVEMENNRVDSGSLDTSFIKSTRNGGNSFDIDKRLYKNEFNDLASLSKKIGIQIYKVNSLQKGYRLTSPDGVLLKKIGLRPGDIVLEVNGIKLLNTRLGLEALNIIRKSSKVRLTITRRGVLKNYTYNIL